MDKHYLLILTIVSQVVLCLGAIGAVKDFSLDAFCPHTKFCSLKEHINVSRLNAQPCCASCMCTADCHLYGNCCPDAQHESDDRIPLPVCYFPVYNGDMETLKNFNESIYTGISSYNSLVTCPKIYQNDDVRARCEGKQRNLEDLAIVSDNHGYVYKNKHCAECYGLSRYISWNLKIKCPTTKDQSEYRMTESLDQFKTCMVWSIPPRPSVGRKSRCFKTVDTCNTTGQFPSLVEPLENACHAYTLYYTHTIHAAKTSLIVYKNVHCFFCNVIRGMLQQFCPLDKTEHGEDQNFVDFTALIDMTSHETVTKPAKSKMERCSKRQIYDPLFNKCQTLTCPRTSVAFYGECLDKYVDTFGFSVNVLVELWPVLNNESLNFRDAFFDYPGNIDDMEEFAKVLSRSVVQPKTSCGHCETTVRESGNNMDRHFIALVTHHTNSKCSTDDLYMNAFTYAHAQEKNIALNIGIKALTYKAIVKNDWSVENFNTLKYRVSLKSKVCELPEPYQGELVCPKITLNETEYNILATKAVYHGPVKRRVTVDTSPSDNDNDVNHLDENPTKAGKLNNKGMTDIKDEHIVYYDLCSKHYMKAVSSGNSCEKKDLTKYIFVLIYVTVMLQILSSL